MADTGWFSKIRPWIIPALLLVAVSAFAWAMNSRSSLSTDLAKEREAADLAKKGYKVAIEASATEIRDLILKNAGLTKQVIELQAATPGAKPTGVITGTTGGVVIGPGPLTVGGKLTVDTGKSRDCRVYVGDQLVVDVNAVPMETKAGNVVMVGTTSVDHISALGGSHVRLLDSPLKFDVKMLPKPKDPAWGAGGIFLFGKFGWAVGPALAFPPVKLFGANLEVTSGLGVGSSGEWAGAALVLVRWP